MYTNPRSTVLFEKLTVNQILYKFPSFYANTMFTAHHLSVSWVRLIQLTPCQYTPLRSRSVLLFHLRLGLASGVFPSEHPTKTIYACRFSSIRATYPVHPIL